MSCQKQTHTGTVLRSLNAGPLVLTEILHPADACLPVHAHPSACFTAVLAGGFRETFGSTRFECGESELLFRPAAAPHSDLFCRAGARALLIEPSAEWLEGVVQHARLLSSPRCVPQRWTWAAALDLQREWNHPDEVSELALNGLALLMAAEVQRCYIEKHSRKIPAWLNRTRYFLHASHRDVLTMNDLAKIACVHPVHLAREFRRHFRCTPAAYVRRLRIETACGMLRNSALPLAEIAAESGFASASQLSRVFRRLMNTTPGNYRLATRT